MGTGCGDRLPIASQNNTPSRTLGYELDNPGPPNPQEEVTVVLSGNSHGSGILNSISPPVSNAKKVFFVSVGEKFRFTIASAYTGHMCQALWDSEVQDAACPKGASRLEGP